MLIYICYIINKIFFLASRYLMYIQNVIPSIIYDLVCCVYNIWIDISDKTYVMPFLWHVLGS